jgi:enoyl-[acyl-carrier protein] reductase II
VIDAVDVPVLAAGGIGDGRGLAAAIAMGGVGVWMGTRFVATREANGHDAYKNRIVEIDDEGTTITRCFSGKPCRVVKNQTTEAWENPELVATIKPFPQQFAVISKWLGFDPYTRGRYEGQTDVGALAAGQSSALIHDVPPAGDVVRRIVAEAERALVRLSASSERIQAEGATNRATAKPMAP